MVIIQPLTHVTATGPTNKKLRCQLPLIVPEGEDCCQLRVADEIITLEAGKVGQALDCCKLAEATLLYKMLSVLNHQLMYVPAGDRFR